MILSFSSGLNVAKEIFLMAGNGEKRIDYIDFMNIYACFSVVCLHCSGNVFKYGLVDEKLFLLCLFIQTLAHASVPIFFMITGTTLLEYRNKYDTKIFLKKRFMKTGIPFIFWSFFYVLRPVWMDGAPFPRLSDIRNALLNNQATNIFWFFYVQFAIYLSIPVFSLIAKVEHFRIVEYICLLSFLATAVYPVVTRFLVPVSSQIIPPFVTGFMGYVFGGWVIYHEKYSRKIRGLIYAIGVAGAFLMFFGTWFLSAKEGATDTFFMEYNSLACYPMSVAIMLLGKHIKWKKIYRLICSDLIAKIASAGLGIYVLHLVLIILVEKVGVLANHTVYFTVIMPFVIYGISLGGVLFLQKIPVIRHVLP